jgi:putative transposase
MDRGLQGVQLVISDAHTGLKAAIGTVFQGASGNAAGSIVCAICLPMSPKATK